MPSTILSAQSGGIALVSGAIYSGTGFLIGGVQFLLDDAAPGPVYIGVPSLSGSPVTINSGGSLSSGGLDDGMRVGPGKDYFVPKARLTSGIEAIRLGVPAASSGGRLYWQAF